MINNQQTKENGGHFLNMQCVGQGVKMLCCTMQSGMGSHPKKEARYIYQIFKCSRQNTDDSLHTGCSKRAMSDNLHVQISKELCEGRMESHVWRA